MKNLMWNQMRKAEYKQKLIDVISAKIDKLTVRQIQKLIAKYA